MNERKRAPLPGQMKQGDLFLAVAVIGIVLMLIVPLPPVLLDFLLSISIMLAVTTLLITLYAEDPLSFSSFPSLLLFVTLFRLGLNVASTRMILADGEAGHIIRAFGEFVAGGNQVVGVIIFILLTIINFVVITKGSGRVAEVAARFTLDALPGRQMAIDADLAAGAVGDAEARRRRDKIAAEADFYGAMDGASKYVRGDAIAGVIILFVNIIGGLAIGLWMKGMSWSAAVDTYVTLTVGDGLVTQIPALLVSVGAGIIITKVSSKQSLGKAFSTQLFNHPKVLLITAALLVLLGLMPGMPLLVMAPMAVALAVYALALQSDAAAEADADDAATAEGHDAEKPQHVESLEVELGSNLTFLAEGPQGSKLLAKVTSLRRQLAGELGIMVPSIRFRDEEALDSEDYVIKIKGDEAARGTLYHDSLLAVARNKRCRPIVGIASHEPATGVPAVWISAEQKQSAEAAGYTVYDVLTVLIDHLTEVVRGHAHELLNRQEALQLVESARGYASAVIDELIPSKLNIGQVLKVFQNLLRERVPVRDIVTILESLADQVARTTDPEVLTEHVRHSLARALTKHHVDSGGVLHAVMLDPKVDGMLVASIEKSSFGARIVVPPGVGQAIRTELAKLLAAERESGARGVVVVSPALRPHLQRWLEVDFPRIVVLSHNEVVAATRVHVLGTIPADVLLGDAEFRVTTADVAALLEKPK